MSSIIFPSEGEGITYYGCYSPFTPAATTTFFHFTISSRRNAAVCSGVMSAGSVLWFASAPLISGDCKHFATAALMTVTIWRAVPTGPASVTQVEDSNPGTPDSAMVGRSGATALRFAVETPSARIRPDLT